MKNILTNIVVIILLCTNTAFSQTAPNLATAADFVLFTGVGEFTSTSSATNVTGNVGNVSGAFVAFPPGLLTGTKHIGDAVAIQASNDINAAYDDLALRTGIAHGTSFGGGEILGPGTYSSAALSTFSGTLTLDAGGDASAIFIIKIDAAFSSVTGAQVVLINGASACNVYWQINGAVELNGTTFKGTMLANGAVNLNVGTNIEGRILNKTGAFIFAEITATICSFSVLPIRLANFDAVKTSGNSVQLSWLTTSEINMSHFEIGTSINGSTFKTTGTVAAKGNNFATQYTFKDADNNKFGIRYYRLKMVSNDATFSYSTIKSVKFGEIANGLINISPNPAVNTINITVNAETSENITLSITKINGQKIRQRIVMLNKGINTISEDIQNLTKAGYYITVKSLHTGKQSQQRFQKL